MKDLPVGRMFHSITYGLNYMGSHASQLTAEDRWKVILYVQTLQNASAEPAEDSGEGESEEGEGEREVSEEEAVTESETDTEENQ